MTPLQELEAAFKETTDGVKHLEMVLAKFQRSSPHIFPKPLCEMGASDKLKIASSIIKMFDLEDEANGQP